MPLISNVISWKKEPLSNPSTLLMSRQLANTYMESLFVEQVSHTKMSLNLGIFPQDPLGSLTSVMKKHHFLFESFLKKQHFTLLLYLLLQ
jgi:hypothetical protein